MKFRFSQDIWVLLGLLVLLVAIALVAGKRPQTGGGVEVIPRRTSYSSSPGGVKALYETLGQLGYKTERHLQSLTTLPADGVLFIIEPEVPLSDSEWKSLEDWVKRGNLMIMATGVAPWGSGSDKRQITRSTPACPSFLAQDVRYHTTIERGRVTYGEWSFENADDIAGPGG